jgi:hypothetical protein
MHGAKAQTDDDSDDENQLVLHGQAPLFLSCDQSVDEANAGEMDTIPFPQASTDLV